jgi:hypothetical protein
VEWQTELLKVIEQLPWRSTNYYSFHQYFVTEWGRECEEGFLLIRNAIKEHGDDRPFTARRRNGTTETWTWTYLDLGDWTYWCGRNWWLKDSFQIMPNVSYGINRKPIGTT